MIDGFRMEGIDISNQFLPKGRGRDILHEHLIPYSILPISTHMAPATVATVGRCEWYIQLYLRLDHI